MLIGIISQHLATLQGCLFIVQLTRVARLLPGPLEILLPHISEALNVGLLHLLVSDGGIPTEVCPVTGHLTERSRHHRTQSSLTATGPAHRYRQRNPATHPDIPPQS